uniref:Toll-like receptor 3 n=1 Tax=Littorina littorea TaxID=31216 RepID=A0A7G8Z9Z5_LITLI|nr:toll-like receptor 3 [Littorina littorea]
MLDRAERQRPLYSTMQLHLIVMTIVASVHAASTSSTLLCTTNPDPKYYPGKLVDCSGRSLKHIPDGIPSETTTLKLSRNNLTLLPNNSFSHLEELRELDLSGNSINQLLPEAFRGLDKLVKLNLCCNQLPLSPQIYSVDLFKPLVSLEILFLNHNSRLVSTSAKQNTNTGSSSTVTKVSSSYAQKHPLSFSSEKKRHRSWIPGGRNPTLRESKVAGDWKSAQRASRKAMRSKAVGIVQKIPRDVELGYPDEALSRLRTLRYLAMDGLTNKTLGHGFRQLTQLTHLDMSGKTGYCYLVTFDMLTLAAVTHLTHLNLSDCGIKTLTSDAFSFLLNLTSLDLSFNQALGFDLLGEAFRGLSHTKLINLTIDAIVPARSLGLIISTGQLRFFRHLTHLERLQARFNRIEAFESGALCSGMPPNLKHVIVDGNLFELAAYLNDLACLESIEMLNMNGLDGYWTPPLRPPDDDDSSDSPQRHKTLRGKAVLRQNTKQVAHSSSATNAPATCEGKQFSVPPKLETFSARDFGLVYKLKKVKVNATNSLKKIDLSENHFPELIGPLCGFQHVEELHLVNSLIGYISHDFFSSFPALRVLNISANYLREVFWHDDKGQVLSGLKNLRVLDLSVNDLGHLPNKTLLHLVNLQELYLSVNGIGSFFLDLSHMAKLQHLDLSKNQLRTIPKNTRDHLDRVAETYNVTINMTFNPISCICQNIDFLEWVRESMVYFGSHSYYWCQQRDGSLIAMENIFDRIKELEYTCTNFAGAFVGASACCVVVGTLLLGALAYRFRWKLRYLYYASRLGLKRSRQQQQERQQQFRYDAFVSFATEDQDFVMGELKSQLEDEQGLQLCIHTRDFMPGQYIASNIVDSVQQSRRTLVVVSRALLDSDWCHYELQMALMESVHTGRDVLLFLLYQHVPAHELPRDMLANLQATSYIEFPEEEDDNRHLFWSRLGQALTA